MTTVVKHVALLRGINVGGNKRVEMSRLKSCFESLGYTNIQTYINSGNVIFESETEDFSKITGTLGMTFGFEIPVLIRSVENIQNLVNKIPNEWRNDDTQKTDIFFLSPGYENEASLQLIKVTPDVDQLIYLDGAIVWNINRNNYGRSGMNKFIGTVLYKNMTARNVNTVRKLSEIMNYN